MQCLFVDIVFELFRFYVDAFCAVGEANIYWLFWRGKTT